jgi:antitoxin FitA
MKPKMQNLHVRGVDNDAVVRLKKKAKAAGKSLNEIAREALVAAAKPSKQEAWAEADRIRARIRARLGHDLNDSTADIRADRDNDERYR